MDYATRSLIDSLATRTAERSIPSNPAPRRISRLDGAIPVKPAAPAPSVPTTKGRSRSVAAVPVVVPPASKKVVRIPRDPAVAAAEAERKLEVKALAEADVARKAKEARVAAEAEAQAAHVAEQEAAEAEQVRLADDRRKASEARAVASTALLTERADFLAFVACADDEAFPYAWSTARREWIMEKAANAEVEWIRARRVELETGIARLLESLALYRAGLIGRLETCDQEVVMEMNKGRSWRSREDWLHLARTSSSQRHLNLLIDTEQLAAGIVANRLEEERKRLTKPADVGAIKGLANALGQKQGSSGTQAADSGKKGKFNILEHLKANAGVPVQPVGKRLSRAEINRQLGIVSDAAEGTSTQVSVAQLSPLAERITRLSPAVVARLHRDGQNAFGGHRWPTIQRLLEIEAKTAAYSLGSNNTCIREGLERFVARCERS